MPENHALPQFPCIDMHSHAGVLFIDEENDGALLGTMAEGGVQAIVLSTIADYVISKWGGEGKPGMPGAMLYNDREPEPGECYSDINAQIDRIDHWIEAHGLVRILGPGDIGDTPGVILAIEGGCHLEGRPERLAEFYDRGLRSMQLVHYRINEFCDIQTSPPRHGGLTDIGVELVREMNRLGILVDVTHASFDSTKDITKASSVPVVMSHVRLQDETPHPRFISIDHARLVAETGGVVGVQGAAFLGHGMTGHMDNIKRMVDAIGIDHVAIGTDMGTATWPPSAAPIYPDFKPFAEICGRLHESGFADNEIAGITSGNFLRVFEAAAGD
jgi:membrane dipeptidase